MGAIEIVLVVAFVTVSAIALYQNHLLRNAGEALIAEKRRSAAWRLQVEKLKITSSFKPGDVLIRNGNIYASNDVAAYSSILNEGDNG